MMPNQTIPYVRVRDINALAKQVLDEHDVFQSVTIRGEVSNFKRYPTALYFSIKDQEARLNVVMFLYKQFPTYLPKDGDDVLISGQITLYVKDGSFQLNARQIQRFGEGDQLLALQQLKEKLLKEGLFDASRKRPFLPYPRHLIVIAGQDSAALKDITFNMERRYPLVTLTIIAAKVQGAFAIESIKNALTIAYTLASDGLILARGGGSEEDLSAFNDESLVRLLATAPFPVIAAIGHEINTSLCDLVADKRASTPTAAVELITPDIRDMLEDLHHARQQSIASIKRGIEWIKLPLQRFAQHPVIKSPYATLDIQKQKVEQMKRDLYQYMTWNVESLSQHALRLKDKLIALSPSRILERGYAIVTNASGKVLRSLDDISLGQTIKTQLKGGMITSTVQEKNTKE
jgi:exodeoxyribonuclease VII large subunit